MTEPGCVYLIGTGPGDPSLVTVRGRQRLAAADVVVADERVHRRLMRWTRPDAERIAAGDGEPGASDPPAVRRLSAARAAAGRTVAHLLPGDPLASEEGVATARLLHDRGVRFEVVPGVPAWTGAAALAGLPLGGRGSGDAVVVISEPAPGKARPLEVEWRRVAPLAATVVCQGGGPTIARAADELLRHGRSPGAPAALVLDGTLASQRTLELTLGEVRATVDGLAESARALLVVGLAARADAALRWFETRPLSGRRVLVTRPRAQAEELVELLADLGAEPVEAPAIRIVPAADPAPLEAACAAAGTFDWIVFTSVNGVDAFLRCLLAGPRDVRALGSSRLCAVGPATSARLRGHGLKPDLMPAEHRAEAVGDALRRDHDLAGTRILLPRADIAGTALPAELRSAGAEVVDVPAYRTVPAAETDGVDASRMLRRHEIDVVTFTSASSVRSFCKRLGPEPAVELLANTTVAAIGPVTADAARRLGISVAILPSTYTVPALVRAIATHFGNLQR